MPKWNFPKKWNEELNISDVHTDGLNLAMAFEILENLHPEIASKLLIERYVLRAFILIIHNEKPIYSENWEQYFLSPNDSLNVIVASAGG